MIRSMMASALLAPTAMAMVAAPVPALAQAGGDLAAVQRSLQALTTMTADFTQTDRAGKVLTGTLTMKKPGKIRFQYEKGVPLLIVADCSTSPVHAPGIVYIDWL